MRKTVLTPPFMILRIMLEAREAAGLLPRLSCAPKNLFTALQNRRSYPEKDAWGPRRPKEPVIGLLVHKSK
jgi:hypothetical protein